MVGERKTRFSTQHALDGLEDKKDSEEERRGGTACKKREKEGEGRIPSYLCESEEVVNCALNEEPSRVRHGTEELLVDHENVHSARTTQHPSTWQSPLIGKSCRDNLGGRTTLHSIDMRELDDW
jgi:hypothetical protein